ncbi:hypothetical protein CQW23_24235 [Capsicum baccatum]|uniref:XS domain-containing protein n=1 Tax=Capsicum baccatum TaxID=33114 RepID=A0A2G2VU75_CAPBA|nr:hypothetical protein CQW23_24235 [Capsicum baccatum]
MVELTRHTLGAVSWLSRTKIEHLESKLGDITHEIEGKVKIDAHSSQEYFPPAADYDKAGENDVEDNELDFIDESDDDLQYDDFDSDVTETSYEMRKKNRWFKQLLESHDSLTVTEINDSERQWHFLHGRELIEHLEEDLRQRGTSVVPPSEMYGKRDGVEFKDKEIVWPPMVVIMNRRLDKDENGKARHSYGPQGHHGMSLLISEAYVVGYIEAEHLSEHFSEMGRDRDAWEYHLVRFCPMGKLLLYGYMADKRDIDNFNQHSTGKSRLKFEIRSYKGTVWNSAKWMRDDNQQLIWFKNKAKALEECLSLDKEMEEFMEEREILVKTHEYRIAALRCKHWEQEVEPERKVDLELAKLMEKYSSKQWHHVTKFLKYSNTIVFKFGTSAELWT